MIERIKRRKELVEGKIDLSVKRSIWTSITINRPVQECILSSNFVPKVPSSTSLPFLSIRADELDRTLGTSQLLGTEAEGYKTKEMALRFRDE